MLGLGIQRLQGKQLLAQLVGDQRGEERQLVGQDVRLPVTGLMLLTLCLGMLSSAQV